jgi:hypothetical protein
VKHGKKPTSKKPQRRERDPEPASIEEEALEGLIPVRGRRKRVPTTTPPFLRQYEDLFRDLAHEANLGGASSGEAFHKPPSEEKKGE